MARLRLALVIAVSLILLAGCVHPRPDWLGLRPLPLRPDGLGQIEPTPPELVDRQFATIDVLPPPPSDVFVSSIQAVPADVVARSTWTPACPVALKDLRYVQVSFYGFDGKFHTGELLIHEAAAAKIVEVFRKLQAARFPIEEMQIPDPALSNAAPTGDGNDTVAFACRPVVTTTQTWSQHAFGLAIDINPFHNPYVKNDIVIPELASAYKARGNVRPGMIEPNDVVVKAFKSVGWTWGGTWSSLRDFQHFSANGK
jgi:hypothetical protein